MLPRLAKIEGSKKTPKMTPAVSNQLLPIAPRPTKKSPAAAPALRDLPDWADQAVRGGDVAAQGIAAAEAPSDRHARLISLEKWRHGRSCPYWDHVWVPKVRNFSTPAAREGEARLGAARPARGLRKGCQRNPVQTAPARYQPDLRDQARRLPAYGPARPRGYRLLTRNGNDWSARFPLVVEAVNHLNVRSCLIDGEVVCCDEKGVAAFHILRRRRNEERAFLYAFDLLELDGLDMRREPIETRKATLASLLRNGKPAVRLNEHIAHSNGAAVFHHACKLGARGNCVEAPGIALPIGEVARLAQVQESGCAGGEA